MNSARNDTEQARRGPLAASLLACLLSAASGPALAQLACTVAQITDSSGGVASFNPSTTSVSADGGRMAFESDRDLTGDNADANGEIFVFDADPPLLTQITDTAAPGGSNSPSISADGTRLVFSSTADLAGTNADGNSEIFLFQAGSTGFAQLTNTAAPIDNGAPSLSANGVRLVFRSNADLTGDNADGNSELFLLEIATGALKQITDTTDTTQPANNRSASINADGTRLVFRSNADLAGGNPDGNSEIFQASCAPPEKADLAVSIAESLDPVPVGTNLSYSITVRNNGPDEATGVALSERLPPLVRLVSVNAPLGTCTDLGTGPTGGNIRCALDDLAAASTAEVAVVVTPLRAGEITNNVSVRADQSDPDAANNSARAVTTVVALPAP
jgi:uncharacterized repeat protein (TIGR01451 family)